jgi:hypothetical protein
MRVKEREDVTLVIVDCGAVRETERHVTEERNENGMVVD